MPDRVVVGLKCSFMKEVHNDCLPKAVGKIRDERTCDKCSDANSTGEYPKHMV